MTKKILCIFGTRPEVIKMAPVIKAMTDHEVPIHLVICVTGQHRQMLDQMLSLFDIQPDYDLNLMKTEHSLSELTANILMALQPIIKKEKPDWIVIQGDTTTCLASALAAFYHKIKLAHIEAGLRSYDYYSPWPEEGNRRLISHLATVHYAPTETAKTHLINENISPKTIQVTGNTGIDALLWANQMIWNDEKNHQTIQRSLSFLNPKKLLVLVTGHRRENWDHGLQQIFQAIKKLAQRDDIEFLYPVHMNPRVKKIAHKVLDNTHNVFLVEPLDYLTFVYAMQRCYIILTDSGGIQEEAPTLGKPILVTRNTTERTEGIKTGSAILAGTSEETIIRHVSALLQDKNLYEKMSLTNNPYGDGLASKRIVEDILQR